MRIAFAATLALLATPALADAVTYRGDFNTFAIILELSDSAESATANVSVGRYAKMEDGTDIPLHLTATGTGTIELTEEAACDEEANSCEIDQSGLIEARTPEAIWSLEIVDNGARLVGTRGMPGSQQQQVYLERTGSRPIELTDPPSPSALADYSLGILWGYEEPLSRETSPYDYLKVTVPLTATPRVYWPGTEHIYVSDPRTLYKYPRVTHPGGANSELNRFLEQRDWGLRLSALNCKSQIYPGMSLSGYGDSNSAGLGGFEDELVEVHYFSETLLSYTESGSVFCGGAYPENHHHTFNLDVATGEEIDISRILKGYVPRDFTSGEIVDIETARLDRAAYSWGADEDLAGFILSRASLPADLAAECGYDDLIRKNLAIGFRKPDLVVFGLDGLPHVIQACAQDLLVAPIAELKDWLQPEAETYFPGVLD